MARQKQSFFGKIMGGDVAEVQEEYYEDTPVQELQQEEDVVAEEELEDDDQLLEDEEDVDYEDEEDEDEEEEIYKEYHNPHWIRDFYFRPNLVAYVEYSVFLFSLSILFLVFY